MTGGADWDRDGQRAVLRKPTDDTADPPGAAHSVGGGAVADGGVVPGGGGAVAEGAAGAGGGALPGGGAVVDGGAVVGGGTGSDGGAVVDGGTGSDGGAVVGGGTGSDGGIVVGGGVVPGGAIVADGVTVPKGGAVPGGPVDQVAPESPSRLPSASVASAAQPESPAAPELPSPPVPAPPPATATLAEFEPRFPAAPEPPMLSAPAGPATPSAWAASTAPHQMPHAATDLPSPMAQVHPVTGAVSAVSVPVPQSAPESTSPMAQVHPVTGAVSALSVPVPQAATDLPSPMAQVHPVTGAASTVSPPMPPAAPEPPSPPAPAHPPATPGSLTTSAPGSLTTSAPDGTASPAPSPPRDQDPHEQPSSAAPAPGRTRNPQTPPSEQPPPTPHGSAPAARQGQAPEAPHTSDPAPRLQHSPRTSHLPTPVPESLPTIDPRLAHALGRPNHGDSVARRAGRSLRQIAASPGQEVVEQTRLAQELQQPVSTGRVIAVTSIRGGVGKSTVSALLGRTFNHYRHDPVLTLEADAALGTLPVRMGADTVRWSCADLAHILTPAMQLTDIIGYLVPVADGGWLLPASQGRVGPPLDVPTYRTVTLALRRYFAVTVVDSETLPGEVARTAMDTAHARVVVAPMTAEGVHGTRQVLDWLARLPHSALTTTIVALTANSPDTTLDEKTAIAHLREPGVPVVAVPYDRHLAQGGPIHTAMLGRATRDAAVRLAAEALRRAMTVR
jgi:MinD-like ATPase involved in chromosome partitioning or flagellar assembly